MHSPKLSLLKNLGLSLFNLKKDQRKFHSAGLLPIEVREKILFTPKTLKRFNQLTHWHELQMPPTFPYALLTHLHFSLVNHHSFPFSPFGLIHKKEKIEIFSPLDEGEWRMSCRIESYRPIERGVEMDIISELTIDDILVWKSTTTAFKKTESALTVKKYPPISVESETRWKIPSYQGLLYGLISNNIDPIHISKPSARIMGHKRAIIHGMWTVARGLSELGSYTYPFTLNVKFISPIYIPTEALFKKEGKGFAVYSADGKRIHLSAEIS